MSVESGPQPDIVSKRTPLEIIQSATSFEELCRLITEHEISIPSSAVFMTPEMLVGRLQGVKGGDSLDLLPRSDGLRDKAAELLQGQERPERAANPPA